MNDILYLVLIVAFFALMLGYVAACARLGRSSGAEETGNDNR